MTRVQDWVEIRDRMMTVADEWNQIADDVEPLVREAPSEPDRRFRTRDPRRSLSDAATYLSSLRYMGDELLRKAETINPVSDPTTEPRQ